MSDTTTRRSPSEVQADLAVCQGWPDFALLHEAVDTTYPAGPGCIPGSVGMDWIGRRTDRFLDALQAEYVSLEDFFAQHYGNGYVAEVLHSKEVLQFLPTIERRTAFVRTILLNCGHRNSGWLRTAREVGIADADLRMMVLDLLERSECAAGQSGFITDFVRYGYGSFHRNNPAHPGWFEGLDASYWHLLTKEQFLYAMTIIIRKWPSVIFEEPGVNDDGGQSTFDRIVARLAESVVDTDTRLGVAIAKALPLVDLAAAQLPNLDGVSVRVFRLLPESRQLALIGQHAETHFAPALLVDLASEMEAEAGIALLQEFAQQLQQVDVTWFYPYWVGLRERRAASGAAYDPAFVHQLEGSLKIGCLLQGWKVGMLTEAMVSVRAGRGSDRRVERRQLQVVDRSFGGKVLCTYIMSYGQVTYLDAKGSVCSPRAGDIVMFQPDGKVLVTGRATVIAVDFRLVYRQPGGHS